MNINKLSEIIRKKILEEIDCDTLEIQDKTYLHMKHSGHDKKKFHIKLILQSSELLKLKKLESTRKIYQILEKELNTHIHSIQIKLI